jgi:GT2 family glycosyltransferase
MSHFDHAGVREVEMISGAALLVRRTTLERVGIFDEGFHFYGEETDYFKRLKSAGGRAVFYPGAEIVHHGTRSPQARYDFFLNLHRGMMRYIRKHHHGFALTAMVTLQYVGHLLRVPLYVAGGLITLDPALMRKGWYYLRVLF